MTAADKMSVLLVDDNIVDRKNIIKMLTTDDSTKYNITDVSSLCDALSILEENHFDVCLADYYLSRDTGLELLEKVQDIAPNTSIIMLTGLDDEKIDNLSFEAGASGFLDKSCLTPALLQRSIRYAIHHKGLSIENEYLAYYDALTKLANRSLFSDRLTHLIDQPLNNKRTHALLNIDLDYFQQVNETYGRAVGDAVLQSLSALLLESAEAIDTVARLSEDEFALILENTTSEKAHTIAQDIIDNIQYPFLINDLTLLMSVSIGMTFFSDGDEKSAQEILEQAEQALSHAKKLGRKCYYQFDNKLEQLTKDNNAFEEELRLAIENDNIFPHYQPQYCLKSGQIKALEALARWQRTDLDLIYPQYFISQIEKLKLMPALTKMMINKVCSDLAKWSEIHPDIKATINISPNSRVNSYLLDVINDALREHNIKPEQLELEFDALALITKPELTSATLNELDQLGISITLNNFGKGDISLFSLAELSISTLKIDMSLIHNIGVSAPKDIIVKVILDIAKDFSIKAVAVGVEKKEQADFLKRHNCDNVQGYLYSRALDFEECSTLLSKTK